MNRTRIAILATAMALGAGIVAANDATANPGYVPTCAGTVVLALDGTKGPTTPTSIDPKSPLNAYADEYRSQPDTIVRHIAYPGGMIPGVRGWEASYNESVRIGAQNLRTEIRDTDIMCGRTTEYVLLGYSQGAEVVNIVASEIDSDRVYDDGTDLQDRTTVRLFADPRTGAGTIHPGDVIDGITLAPPVNYANIPVERMCIPTDLVCDPNGSLLGYILFHGKYDDILLGK